MLTFAKITIKNNYFIKKTKNKIMKFKGLLVALFAILSLSSCSSEEENDYVLFSLPSLVFSCEADTKTVDIYYDGAWTVTVPDDYTSWLSVTETEGEGDATLSVTVEENTSVDGLTGMFFVNKSAFLVGQEGVIEVDINDLVGTWNDASGSFSFTFDADYNCSASIYDTPYVGTYTLSANVISITVDGYAAPITIAVKTLEDDDMTATCMGQTLSLSK